MIGVKRAFGKFAAGLLAGLALILAGGTQSFAQQTPSTKIGLGYLVDPGAAATYYAGIPDAFTNSTGQTGYPNEIVELARALKNDPTEIYKYVYNSINVVWIYGLQKGALGAAIDKSGTPFDQVKLMIDLLRQSGYTASYQLGTITLTGAQFQAWTGITSASGACQLLANGAIPAQINGSVTANCAYGSAAVTSVVMSHIWVQAIINGQTVLFDPSYKTHTFKTGINIASAMGFSSGQTLSQATSGEDTGTASGVSYVHNLNTENLNATLQTYATHLLTQVKGMTVPGGAAPEMEDVVGGRIINRIYPASPAQTALVYTPPSSPLTYAGNLPDKYRTSLEVNVASGTPLWDKVLFADEIYGRKLIVDTNYTQGASTVNGIPGAGFMTYVANFNLVDEFGNATTLANYTNLNLPALYRSGTVTLTVKHPYAASATGAGLDGTYMGLTTVKNIMMALPFVIVHGWGDSDGLVAKWGRRDDTRTPLPPPVACDACGSFYMGSEGDGRREELAAAYIVQSSKAARLNAQISSSFYQLHHAVGVISASTDLLEYVRSLGGGTFNSSTGTYTTPPSLESFFRYLIADSFDQVDIDSGFSVSNFNATTNTRQAASLAIATTLESLEGAVFSQGPDLPDTSSTATRFAWGNRPPSTEDPSAGGPRKFFTFNSAASSSTVQALTKVEGAYSNTGTGTFVAGASNVNLSEFETTLRQTGLASAVAAYAQAGYSITASEEAFLGPGQRIGGLRSYMGAIDSTCSGSSGLADSGTDYFVMQEATSDTPPVMAVSPDSYAGTGGGCLGKVTYYSFDPSQQRGGAFLATRYSATGEPTDVASVLVNFYGLVLKGGGGSSHPGLLSTYSPATAADILKAHFADHTNVLGVDGAKGILSPKAYAGLSVGQGEFPEKLSASLYWTGGQTPSELFGPVTRTQPNAPWTTDWNNDLSMSGSGLEALGASDARAAVGAIVAFAATQDVFLSSPSANRDVTAALTQSWWVNQLGGNVVTVHMGPNSQQFIKLVDGTWIDPSPSTPSSLIVSGSRTIRTGNSCFNGGVGSLLVNSRGWNYANMSFQVVGPHGDKQNFGYWVDQVYNDTCYEAHGFRLNSWTFPRGITVNVAYQAGVDGMGTDALSTVTNSLGRKIHFTYDGVGDIGDLGGFDNGLTGADARSVTFGYPFNNTTSAFVPTATLQDGTQTTFTTLALSNSWNLLTQVFTADNPTVPAVQYNYDTLRRVAQACDALTVLAGGCVASPGAGVRGPYQFYIGDGERAEHDDPAGGRYVVDFEYRHRPSRFTQYVSPTVAYTTTATYDGRSRVTSYTYPEGDQELMGYDLNNNVIAFTKVAKPGSGLANLTASATYDPVWDLPASVTDFRGYTTQLTYVAAGTNGAGELATAVRPNPATGATGGGPTYSFAYNAYGQLTSSTDPLNIVTSHTFDANQYLATTTLDPSGLNLITTMTNDANGEVLSVQSPRTDVTQIAYTTYDLMGRKVFEISPNSNSKDVSGNVLPLLETKHLYDLVGRELQTLSGTGTTTTGSDFAVQKATTNIYDAAGNKIQTTVWNGVVSTDATTALGVTQLAYDAVNRPICTAVRLNASMFAGLPGACTLSPQGVDGPDRITQTVYDLAGETVQVVRGLGLSVQQTYVTNVYGGDGEKLSETDAKNNQTAYQYDGFNRLSQTQFPSPSTINTANPADYEQYGYDNNGNRLSLRKRDGLTISYAYDALNRQTQKTTPCVAGQSACPTTTGASCASPLACVMGYQVNTGYDLDDRPLTLLFGGGAPGLSTAYSGLGIVYTYDHAGRMLTETNTMPAAAQALSYAYDKGGNKTSITYPDAIAFTYGYDGMDRFIWGGNSGNNPATDVGVNFDALGRVSWVGRNHVGGTAYSYDLADRVTKVQIENNNGELWTWSYNAGGQVKSKTGNNSAYDQVPAASTDNRVYDGLNRDLSVTIMTGSTSSGSVANGYDANQNQTLDGEGARSFTYDAENKLVAASGSGTSAAITLAYDPLGRLYQEVATSGGSSTTTQFLYSGDKLVAEYNGAGVMQVRYLHGPSEDQPLIQYGGASVDGTTAQFLYTDRQGSVVALQNTAGTVQTPFTYGPYGEPASWGGTRFAYTGQIELPEARLYHYKARVYDPAQGRFPQTDPIGYGDNLNLYGYVRGDPLNGSDPTGEDTMQCASYPGVWGDYVVCANAVPDGNRNTDVYLTKNGLMGQEKHYFEVRGKQGDADFDSNLAIGLQSYFADGYVAQVGGRPLRNGPGGRAGAASNARQAANAARNAYNTEAEAAEAAASNGWQETNYLSKGARVYRDSRGNYWTRDIPGRSSASSHNGGAWKKASTPDGFGPNDRLGTYDRNLRRIGD